MVETTFAIITGLSIGLMNALDTYRARSIQLINESQFPTDVAIALRLQVNAAIDETIDVIARNPRQPDVLITPVQPALPNFTVPEPPVFIVEVPAPVSVSEPQTGV